MAAAGVVYTTDASGLRPMQLEGFFVDWPSPPSPERHLEVLRGSDHVVLALESGSRRVLGFATAVTDGVLAAYIPLLEVLPDRQGQGIGTELVRRLLEELRGFYMVDLICDEELEAFYRRFGMIPVRGMVLRDPDALDG
ncbi:MAG: GNAT family N-acetyltransferase [Actinobacteria bacterium]|nr:GNAT family N-acetyltransferase [Actinomycetota bacterium]